MSLILEALRKSEAERRLGSAPGVLAPMPVLHASAPRRTSRLAIAAFALAVVAVAGVSWRMFGQTGLEPVEATPSPGKTASAPPPAAVRPDDAPPPVASPAVPLPEPREASIPPSRGPIAVPATAAPASIPSPSAPAPRPAATAAPFLPQPTHAPKPALDRPAPSQPAPPAGPKPAPVEATPVRADAPDTTAPAAAPPAAVFEPALLPITALAPAERGALPALKVSMHVYAEDPAQRFMIVDGHRVGEGDRLGGGVVLVRILRRGAEIDVGGRRLLLPNP